VDIGLLVYPRFTPLELIGPWEVLVRLPEARTHFIWTRAGPVLGEHGLELSATVAFAETPALDVLVIPGGPGQFSLMKHTLLMEFLRERAQSQTWLLALSTGSLLLAQAGVLRGRKATTHWLARETLASFGVDVVEDEYVTDDRIATAAGASGGVDLALEITRRIAGDSEAKAIQLDLGYSPKPPLNAGTPETADADIVERLRSATRQFR
jgi:transcriptional regulator GlxA family with amidase domain